MLLLQELGQHWQMAQAAEPKQQAAVLPSEMMAPMMERETGALGRTDLEMEILYETRNKLSTISVLQSHIYFTLLRDSKSLFCSLWLW